MDNAKALLDRLESLGVGQKTVTNNSQWALFRGQEYSQPDRAITLYNTGGPEPSPAWLLEYPNVQVRVRGPDNQYGIGWAKAEEVKRALLGSPRFEVPNEGMITGIRMLSDITQLGPDESNRHRFTINFALFVEPYPKPGDNREPLG